MCGYLTRTRERNAQGRWVTVTTVYDRPQDIAAACTEDGFPGAGFPDVGDLGSIGSTESKDCEEDGVERPHAAREGDDSDGRPFNDWRAADRALFRDLMDCDHATQKGNRFSVDAVYDGLRKHPRGRIDWPGRYIEGMTDRPDAIDDFLASRYPGLERC